MSNIAGSTQAIRAGTSAAIAGGLASFQDTLFGTADRTVALVVIVLVAIVFGQVTGVLIDKVIESWGFLRGILLARHNIEGYWSDAVVVDGATVVGVFHICLEDESFRVHGVQYDSDGQQIASWHDVLLKFDGQNLRYLYETRYQETNVTQFGYSEITFCRTGRSPYPDCANGHFLDLANPGKTHPFHALRQGREFVSLYGKNPSAAVLRVLASA
jgi:hypothetical protein